MNKLKILLLTISLQLISIGFSFAYCNFEIAGMGSNINELKAKVPSLYVPIGTDNQLTEIKIPAHKICGDPLYKDFTILYEYINSKLVRIRLIDWDVVVNHLENLNYHFGEPKQKNNISYGVNYYYWNLSFREAFLNIETSPSGKINMASVEIMTSDYANQIREYMPEDE